MLLFTRDLFKKSVGVFGVLGSAVSDPLSEPPLRRFRDAPRAHFTEKTNDFATFLSRSWPRFLTFLAPILEGFRASEKEISGDFGPWLLLGLSWCHLGAILALSWAILGLSWAILGRLVAVLEPSWAVLGTI